MSITASPAEHSARSMSEASLKTIRQQISEQGFAVVTNLISAESCAMLATSVTEDAALVRAGGQLTAHEKHTAIGHLQLGLRRHAPFVREDLIANPLIESIVAAVLGSGAWLGFYNGNVNCPGSGYQPLHFDRPFSWKDAASAARDGYSWPPPTTTLSCSVALTDITTANGATEIYPGTHHETEVIGWPAGERVSSHPELIERWGPPAAMEIPAGAICFRDPRMWHRGVHNPTDIPRPMIALTYHSGICWNWRGLRVRVAPELLAQCEADHTLKLMDSGELADGRLVFHDSARPALEASPESHGVHRNVRFVAAPLHVNHFVDAHLPGGARVTEDGNIVPATA